MGKAKGICAAIVLPALAAIWACGGGTSSTGSESGDGGGGGGASGGQSAGIGPCGAESCATGCCDDNGVCQAGTANAACGTANIACQDCTSLGQTCQAGECSNGTPASSSGAGATSSGGTGLPGLPTFDAGILRQRPDAGRTDPYPVFDAGIRTFDAGTFPVFDGGIPTYDGGFPRL
jgi:hypothetical protein